MVVISVATVNSVKAHNGGPVNNSLSGDILRALRRSRDEQQRGQKLKRLASFSRTEWPVLPVSDLQEILKNRSELKLTPEDIRYITALLDNPEKAVRSRVRTVQRRTSRNNTKQEGSKLKTTKKSSKGRSKGHNKKSRSKGHNKKSRLSIGWNNLFQGKESIQNEKRVWDKYRKEENFYMRDFLQMQSKGGYESDREDEFDWDSEGENRMYRDIRDSYTLKNDDRAQLGHQYPISGENSFDQLQGFARGILQSKTYQLRKRNARSFVARNDTVKKIMEKKLLTDRRRKQKDRMK